MSRVFAVQKSFGFLESDACVGFFWREGETVVRWFLRWFYLV